MIVINIYFKDNTGFFPVQLSKTKGRMIATLLLRVFGSAVVDRNDRYHSLGSLSDLLN